MTTHPRTLHLRPAESDLPPATVTVQGGGPAEPQAVTVDDRPYEAAARALPLPAAPVDTTAARLALTIDGRAVLAHVVRRGARIWVHAEGAVWLLEEVSPGALRRLQRVSAGPAPAGAAQGGRLTAAMPGRVLEILCAPGDTVQAGQTLVLLEAMKMELRLAAPAGGVVAALHTSPGAIVERGALLLDIAPAP